MNGKPRGVTAKFMALFIGFYIAQIIYYGLLPSMLAGFGYGETFVGYVMSLMSATALVVRLLLGYLVDKYSCPKGLVITVFTFYAFTQVLLFYFYTSSVYIIFFALTALGLVCVVGGICDTWVVKYREVDPSVDYGKVRSCGSISYAVTGLISGYLIAYFGSGAAAYLALVAWLVVVSAAVLLPNPPKIDKTKGRISLFSGIKLCMKKSPFLMMILCGILNMPAEMSANSYFSIIVTNKGGTSSDIGLGLFVMAFSEFWVVFFFSRLANRFTAERLYYIGFFGNVIRSVALALAPNSTWVIVAIVTQAISFALTMPASVICINEYVGFKYSATAIQFFFVLKGIVTMIGSTPIGFIAENYGINAMLYICAVPAVLGAVILMFYTEKRLKRKTAEVIG